jgi:hypothetical protein
VAKYKTLPNYEFLRPNIHVQFDSQGVFETEDEATIAYLDGLKPFIEREDKPAVKAEVKPAAKPKPKPRATNAK